MSIQQVLKVLLIELHTHTHTHTQTHTHTHTHTLFVPKAKTLVEKLKHSF